MAETASATAPFAELLLTELRRQGVANATEWIDRTARRILVIPIPDNKAADDESTEGQSARVQGVPASASDASGKVDVVVEASIVPRFPLREDEPVRHAVVFNFNSMGVGDKIAIAILEVLLKMCTRTAEWRPDASYMTCAEWHLLLHNNELTDKVTQHLGLVAHHCSPLTVLDVRGNSFSDPAKEELRNLRAELRRLCDLAYDDHGDSNSEAGRARRSLSSVASQRRHPSGRRATSLTSQSTTSLSPLSCSIGQSEALRRRREELFGLSAAAPPKAAVSPDDVQPVPSNRALGHPTTPLQLPAGAAQGPGVVKGKHQDPVTPPPLSPTACREPLQAGTCSPLPVTPIASSLVRTATEPVNDDGRHDGGSSTFQDPLHMDAPSSPQHDGERCDREREPFATEPYDQLDVTANLNPVLDSVLDLSAVADDGGQLRNSAVFGEAKSVWEVIDACEGAVQQTTLNGSVDQDTLARLPAALAGSGMHSALTVLNLSRNGLRELRVLPPTLLRLDVSHNHLTKLDGLHGCPMLSVINARRNEIRAISGLESNLCVAHLFLGHNMIRCVEGLAHLLLLETLDLTHNRLRTHSSIRCLSLCSALRHLLLKGNPVMDTLKGRHRPVLRNLCPTLLVVDDVMIGPSRFADAVQSERNWMRQPKLIDATHPQRPPGGDALALRQSSLPAKDEGKPSMNLLHLITQGVTGSAGYGEASRIHNRAQRISRSMQQKEEDTAKRHTRKTTTSGKPLREQLMATLAAESKRYLEKTIVDRMTQLHPRSDGEGFEKTESTEGPSEALASDPDGEVLRAYRPTRRHKALSRAARRHTSGPDVALVPERKEARRSSVNKATAGVGRGMSPPANLHEATLDELYVEGDCDGVYRRVPHPSDNREDGQGLSYAELYARAGSSPDARYTDRPARDACSVKLTPQHHVSESLEESLEYSPIRRDEESSQSYSTDTSRQHLVEEVGRMGTARCVHKWERYSFPENGAHPSFDDWKPKRPATGGTGVMSPNLPIRERVRAHADVPFKRVLSPSVGEAATSASTSRKSQSVSQPRGMERGASPDLAPPPPMRSSVERPSVERRQLNSDRHGAHRSSRIDKSPPSRVRAWERQVREDAEAVLEALRSVVVLLEAQRAKTQPVPGHARELPRTYLLERRKCTDIIEGSGMLSDTHVPREVVQYYRLSEDELEGRGRSSEVKDVGSSGRQVSVEEDNRRELLRLVRVLGDAKTCLRYLTVLMASGAEHELQDYVDRVKENIL